MALEATAGASAKSRESILSLIGTLVFSWANNESVFIYVLMLLMRTEQSTAAIVFATLNTTRARLDLIQRLSKSQRIDKAVTADLDDLVGRFSKLTRIRNEFNHSMFILNEQGEFTHTQLMRIEESRGRMRFGARRDFDEARIQELRTAVSDLAKLNRDVWAFLPRLEEAMRPQRDAGASPGGPARA